MNAMPPQFPLHDASEGAVSAPVDIVFAHLDDHARLASHMERSSWMLGGGRMHVELDGARGQAVGSRIAMSGKAFGMRLALEEVVTQRRPPAHKSWETIGTPSLLVIGPYRMGFDLQPLPAGSHVRVFIDYALPDTGVACMLGRLFGRGYARWCTRRMVDDAIRHFAMHGRGGEADAR